MLLRVVRPGGGAFFRLFGELDASSVGELTTAVARHVAGRGDVILDLTDLSFTDSSGISGFAQIASAVGPEGNLILLSPRPLVSRALEIAGTQGLRNVVIRRSSGSPPARPVRSPASHDAGDATESLPFIWLE